MELKRLFISYFHSVNSFFLVFSYNIKPNRAYLLITTFGEFIVRTQAVLLLFFVVLFLNFFSKKIKGNGYFVFERKKEN